MKEKIKYDDSTTVVCPSCDEDVCVGSAGPTGLVQHEGKGPCCKAQAKKEQLKHARTLFNIGVKRAKDMIYPTQHSDSKPFFEGQGAISDYSS